MKFAFTLFFSLIVVIHCSGQDAIIQFSVIQIENKVQLDFTIKSGNTCNGIGVYRSADSINFSLIGDIEGVCGSADKNESYSFTDYSPLKNSKNYYRLHPGMLPTSGVAGVFYLDLSENEVLVYPNPVTYASSIFSLNPSHEERTLNVFSREGKHVYKSEPSRTNSFPLPDDFFIPGIYYFTISSGNAERFKGNLRCNKFVYTIAILL
jgi:hypothetical protein